MKQTCSEEEEAGRKEEQVVETGAGFGEPNLKTRGKTGLIAEQTYKHKPEIMTSRHCPPTNRPGVQPTVMWK